MPMRPWTVRLLDLIDQGVTEREALIEGATPWVPLGHAFRQREAHNRHAVQRQHLKAEPTKKQTMPERSLSEIQRVGARQILHKSLRSLVTGGVLTREGTQYRRPDIGREHVEPPADVERNGHRPS